MRDDAGLPYSHVARSPARATATSRRPMRWSAVCSRWPLEERPSAHEGLALAVVQAESGALVAASSVLPWRGAGAHWPGDATARLEDRFRLALDEQRAQIEQAAAGGPVVWRGDVNLALQGDEHAGVKANRPDLEKAFAGFGLSAPTAGLPHLIPTLATIDHVAVPTGWQAQAERHEPGLSDHALYLVRAQPTCAAAG